MPALSTFEVTFPSTISIENPLTTCEVEYNSITYTMTCAQAGNVISLTNGLTVSVGSGEVLKLRIGIVTNPVIQVSDYGTFELVSYTDVTFAYQID